MMFEWWVYLTIAVIGVFTGVLGGMLGVGGSLIMIPALAVLFGQGEAEPGLAGKFSQFNQHLYQASAMIVNVFVAAGSTYRHVQHRAVLGEVTRVMLPAAVIAILLGVWCSNLPVFAGTIGPIWLGRVMAVFMLYVIWVNVMRLFRKPVTKDRTEALRHVTATRSAVTGAAMGFIAGLLGVGGGAIAVPMQQLLLRLPLRHCIANSAAVMCISAIVGAVYKNASLAQHGLNVNDSFVVAALLAPLAIGGAYFGGRLTHVMPIRVVRGVFIVILVLATWKMAAV